MEDAPELDYGSDGDLDTEVIARAFAELDELTLRAERATAIRKRAEDALTLAKQAEDKLLTKDIPDLLLRMRLDKCTTASGIDVAVRREIKASLPGRERVEARMGAFRWLVESGNGGVVKNVVKVDLDRGEDARADDLVVQLRSQGFAVDAQKDVHPSTLTALVKELFAEGKLVPREFFNLFDAKTAKLSRKDP